MKSVSLTSFLVWLLLWCGCNEPTQPHVWNAKQRLDISKLNLKNLPPLPPDPSNRVADIPEAADLGQVLFFDRGLSGNNEISCNHCHQADQYFQDGLPLAKAIGTTKRHTPSLVGLAYSPWFYWDGRKDSQWSQALEPLETDVEHGAFRTDVVRHVLAEYREPMEALFGPLPDFSDRSRFPPGAGPLGPEEAVALWSQMSEADRRSVNEVFASVGKLLAAYQRTLIPGRSKFDEYADAVEANDLAAMQTIFTEEEAKGLELFIGEANCLECHHGPRFTNDEFHNIGLPQPPNTKFDNGRIGGAEKVVLDEFNCTSPYSDAGEDDCDELRFMKSKGIELMGGFKAPSLRNVANTAPYMHDGSMPTLGSVILHYNTAPKPFTGHSDLVPLELSVEEIKALEAFLETLSAPVNVPASRLEDPHATG